MGTRHASWVVAFAVFLSGGPVLAQTGSKGWLEKLSGPGPFSGWEFSTPPLLCFGRDTGARVFVDGVDAYARQTCFDLGVGRFRTDPDPAFAGRVRATTFDLRAVFQAHPAVSLGGGGGFVRFTGRGFGFTRATVIPARVVFKPFRLGPRQPETPWRGVLQLQFKEYWIAGRLTGADFNAPRVPLDESWEAVRYISIVVDVSEWLWPRRNADGHRSVSSGRW